MFKVAYYEMKKMLRDYRLIIIFILQPIILTYLLGNTAAHYPKNIDVAVFSRYDNHASAQIVQRIKEISKFKVTQFSTEQSARDNIENDKSKLAVIISVGSNNGNKVEMITNATMPELSQTAQAEVAKEIYGLDPSLNLQINTENNTKRDINFFSYYASAIMVLILVLIGLNASVSAITQERVDGTFERFFVTPYSKTSMIFGKMISYVGVSLVISFILIFCMKVFFNVSLGALWLVGLMVFASGMAAISLGLLISAFTYTIGESIQVGALVFFALLILTGLIFQPETMQSVVSKIFYLVPFSYAIIGMREVNILGFGFNKVYPDIIILFGSAFLFLFAAVLTLRRKAN